MLNKIKIIVIGLDGGTFDVMIPGIRQGKLPTFKRLMEKGVYGKLRSVIPPITAPAWASFFTGKNPGKHGIFDFYLPKNDSYGRRPVTASDISARTFYEILSVEGKRVGMLNVPMTYPPRAVNGFIVTGMLTSPGVRYTYPPTLQKHLDSMGYQIESNPHGSANKETYVRKIVEIIEKRKEALFYLMETCKSDFLMCVYRVTDVTSHTFWKYQDITHSRYDENLSKKYGSVVIKVYQKIDEILDELVSKIDKDTVLIVMSDHGFEKQERIVHLNMWLMQQGYLNLKRSIKTKLKEFLFRHGFTPDRLWEPVAKINFVYEKMIKDLNRRNEAAEKVFLSYSDVDWENTLAYAMGSVGSYGLIHINKKGREPGGIVAGSEYESLRKDIINCLSQLEDSENHDRVVDVIYCKEEIYSGEYLERLPDIIIKWKQGYITHPFFAGGGRIITRSPSTASGNHEIDGIFIAYGPSVARKAIRNIRIIDLAPTILHIMGIPTPKDMDGRVLKEIFEDDSEIARRPIVHLTAETRSGKIETERHIRIRNKIRELKQGGKL